MIDQLQFRQVLGQFPTGITIVTSKLGDQLYGFTANSFTSVSLDPPLVLFCMNKASEGCELIMESGSFAINFLDIRQEMLSNRFANGDLDMDQRFEGLSYSEGITGCPLLAHTMGSLDCELFATYEGGDHWIFTGRVLDLQLGEGEPLIYFRGRYNGFGAQ